jgi:hypothetical protein
MKLQLSITRLLQFLRAVLVIACSLSLTANAQQRHGRRKTQSANKPAQQSSSRVTETITPKVEAASSSNRMTIDWTPATGVSRPGATAKFRLVYIWDDNFWQIGKRNDVIIAFDVTSRQELCAGGGCQMQVKADGVEVPIGGPAVPVLSLPGGGQRALLQVTMRPRIFAPMARATRVEIKVGNVSFVLSEAQLAAVRQVGPYLQESVTAFDIARAFTPATRPHYDDTPELRSALEAVFADYMRAEMNGDKELMNSLVDEGFYRQTLDQRILSSREKYLEQLLPLQMELGRHYQVGQQKWEINSGNPRLRELLKFDGRGKEANILVTIMVDFVQTEAGWKVASFAMRRGDWLNPS